MQARTRMGEPNESLRCDRRATNVSGATTQGAALCHGCAHTPGAGTARSSSRDTCRRGWRIEGRGAPPQALALALPLALSLALPLGLQCTAPAGGATSASADAFAAPETQANARGSVIRHSQGGCAFIGAPRSVMLGHRSVKALSLRGPRSVGPSFGRVSLLAIGAAASRLIGAWRLERAGQGAPPRGLGPGIALSPAFRPALRLAVHGDRRRRHERLSRRLRCARNTSQRTGVCITTQSGWLRFYRGAGWRDARPPIC